MSLYSIPKECKAWVYKIEWDRAEKGKYIVALGKCKFKDGGYGFNWSVGKHFSVKSEAEELASAVNKALQLLATHHVFTYRDRKKTDVDY